MNTLDEAIYRIIKLLNLSDMDIRTFEKGRSVEISLHRPQHIENFEYVIRRSEYLVVHKKKEFRRFTRFIIKRNYKYSFNDYKKFVNRLKDFSRDEYFRSLGL
jgi:cobalamin biosynthesis Co2+ chelatase CbiK|tara:strand:+ start:487 stop:795 length:309 start_codon:yes stop_codon:yes gene_type:complete